jgi:hypothetical protein
MIQEEKLVAGDKRQTFREDDQGGQNGHPTEVGEDDVATSGNFRRCAMFNEGPVGQRPNAR